MILKTFTLFPTCSPSRQLLDDDSFSDVTLCLSGQKWAAHRAILSLRSAVFRAMFSSDLYDQNSNCVELTEDTEVDDAAWLDFLTFLYTGSAPKLDVHCLSLLKLADKYEVRSLQIELKMYTNCSRKVGPASPLIIRNNY